MVDINRLENLNLETVPASENSTKSKKAEGEKIGGHLNGKGAYLKGGQTGKYSYETKDGIKLTNDYNEKLANDLYNQINGFSSASNTKKILDKLDIENINMVMLKYQLLSGESLMDSLDGEWGISIEDQKDYIVKPLIFQAIGLGIKSVSYDDLGKIENIKDLKKYVSEVNIKLSDAAVTKKRKTNDSQKKQMGAIYHDASYYNPEMRKISLEEYSLQALREKYPQDKYIADSGSKNSLYVMSKNNLKSVTDVKITADGDTVIRDYYGNEKPMLTRIYDTKGELKSYIQKGVTHYPFAEDLYQALNSEDLKDSVTGNEDITEMVKRITPENVSSVLKDYSSNAEGELKPEEEHSLLHGIMSRTLMSTEKKVELTKHILNMQLESAKNRGIFTDDIETYMNRHLGYEKNKIGKMDSTTLEKDIYRMETRLNSIYQNQGLKEANGKIDGDFKQSSTGDCWLLASIKAIANTPEGLKELNDCIKRDDKGNIYVTLKGVNKSYIISPDELKGAVELSVGDADVRALEIAVRNYMLEEKGEDIKGNHATTAYKILTNKGNVNRVSMSNVKDKLFNSQDSLMNRVNKGKAVLSVSTADKHINSAYNEQGQSIDIQGRHAYSVVGSDENFVYLVNPWDTSKNIRMMKEDFSKVFNSVNILEF